MNQTLKTQSFLLAFILLFGLCQEATARPPLDLPRFMKFICGEYRNDVHEKMSRCQCISASDDILNFKKVDLRNYTHEQAAKKINAINARNVTYKHTVFDPYTKERSTTVQIEFSKYGEVEGALFHYGKNGWFDGVCP